MVIGRAEVVAQRSERLLIAASQPDRLWESWDRVFANQGAAGGDGVSVDRFSFFADHAIGKLSAALRDGTYRPAPARKVEIPKKSGGTRPLTIPAVVDRIAQGAVALTIGPMLDAEMEDSSFAYRAGRGVADAVRRVASLRRDGFRWVVDGDIRRYFDTIPHDRLLDRVERCTGDDALLDLIAQWLEWYAPGGRGVPQGSPLSPLLANIYLDAVDEAIATRGLRLVRYADDFVILAKSETAAQGALERISALLSEHGLELHPEKTRIVSFDQGLRFLGHLFVRSMVLREVEWDTPDEEAALASEGRLADLWDADQRAPFSAEEPVDPAHRSPGWRVLYVLEPGRFVDADGESFAVLSGGVPIFKSPAARVGRIELAEGLVVSPAALDLAAAHDVIVARIDGNGRTVGEWVPPTAIALHGKRHLAQASVILDGAKRIDLARILVEGRIRGQRAVLSRANRDRRDPTITAAIARYRAILRSAAGSKAVDALMGWEGHATQLYWPALAHALDGGIGFSGQRRRRDQASAFDLLLNSLASLLARDIRVALMRHGLHPGLSVLHETRDGGDALVFDLMEEFRAPLVEATAVALVNRRAVREEMLSADRGGRARLARDGWKAIIRGYEGALDRPSASKLRDGDRVSWRVQMSDQAALLAAHFEGRQRYQTISLDY